MITAGPRLGSRTAALLLGACLLFSGCRGGINYRPVPLDVQEYTYSILQDQSEKEPETIQAILLITVAMDENLIKFNALLYGDTAGRMRIDLLNLMRQPSIAMLYDHGRVLYRDNDNRRYYVGHEDDPNLLMSLPLSIDFRGFYQALVGGYQLENDMHMQMGEGLYRFENAEKVYIFDRLQHSLVAATFITPDGRKRTHHYTDYTDRNGFKLPRGIEISAENFKMTIQIRKIKAGGVLNPKKFAISIPNSYQQILLEPMSTSP